MKNKSFSFKNLSFKSLFGKSFDSSSINFNDSFMDSSKNSPYYIYGTISALGHAVDMISDKVSDISFVIKTKEGSLVNSSKGDKVLNLLNRPNKVHTTKDFLAQIATEFLLYNNAYVYLGGNINYTPSMMFPISSKSINITMSSDGKLYTVSGTGFESSFNGIYSINLETGRVLSDINIGEIVHLRGYIKNGSNQSKSKVDALCKQVEMINSAWLSLKSGLDSGFNAGAIIGVDTKNKSIFNQFVQDVQNFFSGPNNSRRAMVMQTDKYKVDHQKLSNRDMQILEIMTEAKKSVYERYEIPEPLVNSSAQTYNNYQTAMYALYDNAILPLFNTIATKLTDAMRDRNLLTYDEKITYDNSTIPTLKVREAEDLVAYEQTGALTINEMRIKMGYKPLEELEANIPTKLLEKSKSENKKENLKTDFFKSISGLSVKDAGEVWDVSERIIEEG
jgi:HK97 family phage portal protein